MFTLDEYKTEFEKLQDGYTIQEVEPKDGVRMFEVVKIPEPTAEEMAEREISELKRFLSDTDYVACKLIEATDEAEMQDLKEKYADVLKQRREARSRINKLGE